MIASLRGIVLALEANSVVLDVSGVGYLVQITGPTSKAVRVNEELILNTALVIREDAFTLFGFATLQELRTFDLLRSVSGVGPKSALSILGAMSLVEIVEAVAKEDDAAFKAVSGVGPKTAKLIIVTLAGKLGTSNTTVSTVVSSHSTVVTSALTGLGWPEKASSDAVSVAVKALGAKAANGDLLKYALAHLGASKSVGVSDE